MTPAELTHWNTTLRTKSPFEIMQWAIAQAAGRAVVSTNFRPYEAAILHLAVQAQPNIPRQPRPALLRYKFRRTESEPVVLRHRR